MSNFAGKLSAFAMSSNLNILLIDNKDSFTFNLVQSFEELHCKITVCADPQDIRKLLPAYQRIVFSPGPGLPEDFPLMFEILSIINPSTKVLGVCLGHQAIATFFGATLFRQNNVQHGKKKQVFNKCTNHKSILYHMPEIFEVGLYHSWAVQADAIPDVLTVSCLSEDGIVMGLYHKDLPVEGIQFHPESFLTPNGSKMLENWLHL